MVLFTSGIVGLLLVAAWLAPRLLSLFYQVVGSQLMEQVLQTAVEEDKQAIPCTLDPIAAGTARMKLERAVQLLTRSSKHNPNNSHTYLLLGRTYCLLGDLEPSIEAYRQYANFRPENPLGKIELGFAYANSCKSQGGTQSEDSVLVPCDEGNVDLVLQEFSRANIDPGQFLFAADDAYQRQRWGQAQYFYFLSEKLGLPVSPEARFRKEIAAIMENQNKNLQRELPDLLTTHVLADSLQIEAETLQWYLDATPLQLNPGGDPNAGVFWWNGDAITGLEVLESEEYNIMVSAQNTPPAPVQFQITVDFQPAGTFDLVQEDMSWQEFSINISLDAGFHVLGVRFLNDDFVNGLDRNLYIDWLKVHK